MGNLRQTYRDPAGPSNARRTAVTWSIVGFAIATIFWSVTGYAPGLGVLARGAAPERTGSITTAPEKLADRVPALTRSESGRMVRTNCTALVLDRADQLTRPADCLADAPELEYAETNGRQDRLLLRE